MRDLDQIQRWLQAVIVHPQGIVPGIEGEAAQQEIGVAPDNIEEVICRSKALSSTERLEIYNNAYHARLLECLGESFPVLKQTVGEELFNEFALGYLQSYPSTSYTLTRLGARFADYLQETRPDADELPPGEVGWPDLLIDLARLDWNIAEVFDGPGAEELPVLSMADVKAIAPQQWPAARLVPVPCLRLLEFHYEIHDYFTAVKSGEQPELPAAGPCHVALTRINYVVRRILITPAQFELLAALIAGRTVGEAIEQAAAKSSGDLGELAAELSAWFAEWAAARLFLAVELPQ